MRNWFKAKMEADEELAGLLTGGITAADLTSATEGAFDEYGEIKPCATVHMIAEAPFGPLPTSSLMQIQLSFRQRGGTDVLEAAQAAAYRIFHRLRPGDAPGPVSQIFHDFDGPPMDDAAFRCYLAVSQFRVVRTR